MTWHIFTGEYPPAGGGVGDYSRRVAEAMAADGADAHVWTSSPAPASTLESQAVVHRLRRGWSPFGLAQLSAQLACHTRPRRLLVEYAPTNFGCRSINAAFALWVWWRAVYHRDRVGVMFHEYGLPFAPGWKRVNLAAALHRAMALLVVRASRRVWVSIPRIGEHVRRLQIPAAREPIWLPVPSNIPVVPMSEEERREWRTRNAGARRYVIGHFGTYTGHTDQALKALLPRVAAAVPEGMILLFGRRSRAFAEDLLGAFPELRGRVRGYDELPASELSRLLQTCDLMLQPYPDGVSTRRGSLMAGLAHAKAILTNSGASTEAIWTESGAVELLPGGATPEAYAETATRLLSAPRELTRLGTAAGKLYVERFDLAHTIRALHRAVAEGF